jgi:hypothetical protein
MGYLNKAQYDYRRESAAKKMREQRSITSLTEEQHEALSDVCRIRHELHCSMEDRFYTGSCNFSAHWHYCNNDYDSSIYAILKNVGLENNLFWNNEEIPNDMDWEDYEEWDCWEDAYQACYDFCGNINKEIEQYLRNVDKKHGTEYAPSGSLRIG